MGSSKALFVLAFALAAPAAAGTGDPPAAGAALYREKTCIACHGADARTPILPDYPKLAGQNAAYLLRQAQDIKSGARSNGSTAAMKGVMHLVNDEELRAISEWLASLD